jgi:hypothetical protein
MEKRLENLIAFSQGVFRRENGRALYEKYLEDIKTVTPSDLMLVQHEQLKQGLTPREMAGFVDKLMNVFHEPLSTYPWEKPGEDTFIGLLMAENRGLKEILEAFKAVIKEGDHDRNRERIKNFIDEIEIYNEHLLKLENILFPMMEKKMERFKGLAILWVVHDESRDLIKSLKDQVRRRKMDHGDLGRLLGALYFKLFGLIEKQELVLFPAAMDHLTEEEHEGMHLQSFEYGFAYIEAPDKPRGPGDREDLTFDPLSGLFQSETGHFDLQQLMGIFQHLPVDLTLVDENDKVAYFSKPKERIFPRSKAVIGRDVRMCHPPDSVHMVEKIMAAFKKGDRDRASFWSEMSGLFLFIQYHALRDKEGRYRGTLEVTQEISDLRALEGERRLLDWE